MLQRASEMRKSQNVKSANVYRQLFFFCQFPPSRQLSQAKTFHKVVEKVSLPSMMWISFQSTTFQALKEFCRQGFLWRHVTDSIKHSTRKRRHKCDQRRKICMLIVRLVRDVTSRVQYNSIHLWQTNPNPNPKLLCCKYKVHLTCRHIYRTNKLNIVSYEFISYSHLWFWLLSAWVGKIWWASLVREGDFSVVENLDNYKLILIYCANVDSRLTFSCVVLLSRVSFVCVFPRHTWNLIP